ncbi:MAG: antibiotic biosynthesis monooxygenase [Planctomycetes bacterium]|nr:antibiotic biosynthesis monooxygenase [Planctomycetota bacterium]
MSILIRTTLMLIIVLLLAAPALAQDKENPIEKEVKASLKDPSKPFVMYVHLKIKEGNAAKFEAAFAKARTATRKEKGNKAYSLTRSTKAPNEYIVYERWDNLAALQAHLKAAHITALLTEVGDMLDGAPAVKVYLPTRE